MNQFERIKYLLLGAINEGSSYNDLQKILSMTLHVVEKINDIENQDDIFGDELFRDVSSKEIIEEFLFCRN